MRVIVDVCVVPMGVGFSVSKHIAACQKVIQASGLEPSMHAYGTNIEGEWDDVFAVIKCCHEIVVNEMRAPRISTTIKCGTRTDREQTMDDKVIRSGGFTRPTHSSVPAVVYLTSFP